MDTLNRSIYVARRLTDIKKLKNAPKFEMSKWAES